MNEYSVKTALYREKTGKGTKFLTFLAFWYPILRFIPNTLAIIVIYAQFTKLSQTFPLLEVVSLAILVVMELALGYFLPRLKPSGFYYGMVCFSLRTIVTVYETIALKDNSYLLDLLFCVLIVIYLINRKSLYGISTENQPAITLSPDVILHNSAFKCGVTWQMGGTIRFTDAHLVMEGDFLPSKTFSFPYETLQVQHNKLMLCWQFQNVDSKQQIQVKILPFHGNGLKKLLRQQGVTPTVK